MHEFSVSAAASGAATVVVVTGEVDLATADRLRAAVRQQIKPGREVHVDCARVGFLDSAGLRVLLEMDRMARAAGAVLTLTEPSAAVSRTLELAGVADLFRVGHA